MYIGAYLTMEWWNAGFETQIKNPDNWELKWHHNGDLKRWSDPACPFWANSGDPLDVNAGAPIQSACKTNAETPDRVVFLALDWEYLTEEDWLSHLNQAIENIKTNFPSAKRIDLMHMVKCPNDMMCNPGIQYGPGADDNVGRQDCYIPPYEDSAFAKAIAAQPGLLAMGPYPSMAECNPAHNGAHMTGAGNSQAAKDIAAYYNMHP